MFEVFEVDSHFLSDVREPLSKAGISLLIKRLSRRLEVVSRIRLKRFILPSVTQGDPNTGLAYAK